MNNYHVSESVLEITISPRPIKVITEKKNLKNKFRIFLDVATVTLLLILSLPLLPTFLAMEYYTKKEC